jgi:hypothetical protein
MIDNIRTTGAGPVYSTAPAHRAPATAAPVDGPAETKIPKTPPAEVLHALDRAQQVIADLASKNLEIRFAVNDGHVRTQLVDDEGRIVQEIPVRHGLDVLAGQRLFDGKA